MRSRLGVVAMVATGCVVAVMMASNLPGPIPDVQPIRSNPVASRPEDAASTWYCPAAGSGAERVARHELFVSNQRDGGTEVEVTSYRSDGQPPVPTRRHIPAHTTVHFSQDDMGTPDPGSVLVEAAAGGIVVEHRLDADGLVDQTPCATEAGDAWHFPLADTRLGSTTTVWLFNPFPDDATVDVDVASEDGSHVPGPFSGVVVRARSFRVLDIGAVVQRREQFAMSVRSRAGVIVAEMVEVSDGSQAVRGLRTQVGVPLAAARVAFADGFLAPNMTERYVLYNPASEPTNVMVSVTPAVPDPTTLPEPFQVEIPQDRFTVLDLDQQSRVPNDQAYWVTAESVDGVGIVVGREVTATASPNVLGLRAGRAAVTGSPVVATRFVLGGVTEAGLRHDLLLANPSSAEATVTLDIQIDASSRPLTGDPILLAPGTVRTVDLKGIGKGTVAALTVTASQPILAERRSNGTSNADFWVELATPQRGTTSPVPPAPVPAVGQGGS